MAENTRGNEVMRTVKGVSQQTGLITKETGLGVSGNLVYDDIYLVVNMPAFTVSAGNVIKFSSFTDLSAVRPGDIFQDNTAPTPVDHTVVSVDKTNLQVTLGSSPVVLTAGGAVYRTAVVNAIAVYGINMSGGTASGMDVNLFDENGEAYTLMNPLPVQLSTGSINVSNLEIDEVSVHLDHTDRDVIDYRGGLESGAAPITTLDINYTANLSFVDNSITYAPGANFTFNDNDPAADTIVDSANGFIAAGFQPGDTIVITGSVSNDGTYTIAAGGVAAGVLTLEATDVLTDELVAVAASIYTNNPQDTITDGAAQFVAEGFQSGMEITVSGSVSNDGTYTIDTVAVGTLTLITGDSLTSEGPVAVTLTSTNSKFNINIDGDGAQEIDLTDYVLLDSGDKIAASIQSKVRSLVANSASNQDAIDNFSCIYDSSATKYKLWSSTWGGSSSVVVTAATSSDISGYLKLSAAGGGTAITEPQVHTISGDSVRIGDGTDLLDIVDEDDDISTNDNGIIIYGESVSQTSKKLQIVEQDDVMAAGEDKGIISYFKSAGSGGDQPEVARSLNVASQGDDISTNDLGAIVYGRKIDDTATVPLFVEAGDSIAGAGDDAGMIIYGEAVDQTAKILQIVEETDVMAAGEDKGILIYAKSAGVAPDVADTLNIATQGDALGTNNHGIVIYGRNIAANATIPVFVEAGDSIAGAGDDSGILMYGEAVDQTAKIHQVVEDGDTLGAGEDKGFITYFKSASATPEAADTFNVAFEGDAVGTYGRGVMVYGRDPSDNAKTLEFNAAGELIVSAINGYAYETVSVTLSTGPKVIVSDPLPYTKVSVHLVWSGLDAVDSTLVVQVSNDNTNWQNLPIGVISLSVAASDTMVFSQDIPYRYMRLYYTVGAVTAGTINAYVCFKS